MHPLTPTIRHTIDRLDKLALLLDSQFGLGPFKFGLDPILGLIPGIGDVITILFSLSIVGVALRLGLPSSLISRMLFNVALDFLVGLVPIIGDLFDIALKSNRRNIHILKQYYQY